MVLYYLTVNVNIFFLSLLHNNNNKYNNQHAFIMDEAKSINDVYAIAKFARDILRRNHGHIEPPNTILRVEAAISSLYECREDDPTRDRDFAIHPFSDDNGIPFLRIFFHKYGSPDIQAEVTECLNRLNAALGHTLNYYRRRILIPKFVNHNRSVIFSLPKQQLQLFRSNWGSRDDTTTKFLREWHNKFSSSKPIRSSMKSSMKSSKSTMGGKKRKRANHTQRRRR